MVYVWCSEPRIYARLCMIGMVMVYVWCSEPRMRIHARLCMIGMAWWFHGFLVP